MLDVGLIGDKWGWNEGKKGVKGNGSEDTVEITERKQKKW